MGMVLEFICVCVIMFIYTHWKEPQEQTFMYQKLVFIEFHEFWANGLHYLPTSLILSLQMSCFFFLVGCLFVWMGDVRSLFSIWSIEQHEKQFFHMILQYSPLNVITSINWPSWKKGKGSFNDNNWWLQIDVWITADKCGVDVKQ